MSCSNRCRPGTLVRVRIHAITKPNTSAITVAATDTVNVLSRICGYWNMPLKLSNPYAVGGRTCGSPTSSAACSRKNTGYSTRTAAMAATPYPAIFCAEISDLADCTAAPSQAEHTVPFFGEDIAVGRAVVPVGRAEQVE